MATGGIHVLRYDGSRKGGAGLGNRWSDGERELGVGRLGSTLTLGRDGVNNVRW